jgi:two-component system sensor histidine kinase KdpD
MIYLKERLLPFLYRHTAAMVVVILVTLLLRPFFEYLGAQVIALIYLAPVILVTLIWGLTPGVLAGFISFLAFNYFLIPPYHTFVVTKPQDIITLIIFLIISVMTSQLIGQAREGVHLAKIREWEATRMVELISALAGATNDESVARILAQHTKDTFHSDCVEVVVQNSGHHSFCPR